MTQKGSIEERFDHSVREREKYREVPSAFLRRNIGELSDSCTNQKIARAPANTSKIVTLMLLSNKSSLERLQTQCNLREHY